jgi:hypothetical protein
LALSLRNYDDDYLNQAGADYLDMLVTLFDAYRVLYDPGSDMISAREFLSDRIANPFCSSPLMTRNVVA